MRRFQRGLDFHLAPQVSQVKSPLFTTCGPLYDEAAEIDISFEKDERWNVTQLEAICRMVHDLLTSAEFNAECSRQDEGERAHFMMVVASFLEWQVARICSTFWPANEITNVIMNIQSQVSQQNWFVPAEFPAIREAVHNALRIMRPGPRTGVLMPFVHAIEGANAIGYKLSHSDDGDFLFYTIGAWEYLSNEIPKACNVQYDVVLRFGRLRLRLPGFLSRWLRRGP